MTAIVSEKGQVTIPKVVRDKLGIRSGTVMDFTTSDGKLVGKKQMHDDVFKKWRGRVKLPRGMTVDEYLKYIRGC